VTFLVRNQMWSPGEVHGRAMGANPCAGPKRRGNETPSGLGPPPVEEGGGGRAWPKAKRGPGSPAEKRKRGVGLGPARKKPGKKGPKERNKPQPARVRGPPAPWTAEGDESMGGARGPESARSAHPRIEKARLWALGRGERGKPRAQRERWGPPSTRAAGIFVVALAKNQTSRRQ